MIELSTQAAQEHEVDPVDALLREAFAEAEGRD